MLETQEIRRPGGRVVLMDTITKVRDDHAGAVVVSGSHGGTSSASFALGPALRLTVFNDAGIGKQEAGIAALAMLQARARAAVTVAHTSARIGDARDTWDCGVISRVNEAARSQGLREGMRLKEGIDAMLGLPTR